MNESLWMLNSEDSEVYLGWLLTWPLCTVGWCDHMWACLGFLQHGYYSWYFYIQCSSSGVALVVRLEKLLYYFKWLWNNKINNNLKCQRKLFSSNLKNNSTRSTYKIYTKGENSVTDYWVPCIIFIVGTRMFAMQQYVVKIKISFQISQGIFFHVKPQDETTRRKWFIDYNI